MKRHTDKMIKDFERAIKNWRHEPDDDQEMIDCYSDDRKDLKHALKLMTLGMYEQAWDIVAGLDTIVRDQVPEDVYNFLMRIGDPHMAELWSSRAPRI